MLKVIFFSHYNSESSMEGCVSSSLDVALKPVDDHHFPPCQIHGEMMEKIQLQDCSILEKKSCCMSEISSWLLKPIAKKRSIQYVLAGGLFMKNLFEE